MLIQLYHSIQHSITLQPLHFSHSRSIALSLSHSPLHPITADSDCLEFQCCPSVLSLTLSEHLCLDSSKTHSSKQASIMLGRLGAGARSSAAPLFKRQLLAGSQRHASSSAGAAEVGGSRPLERKPYMLILSVSYYASTFYTLATSMPTNAHPSTLHPPSIEQFRPIPIGRVLWISDTQRIAMDAQCTLLRYFKLLSIASRSPSSAPSPPSPSSPSSLAAVSPCTLLNMAFQAYKKHKQ